jgi:transposase
MARSTAIAFAPMSNALRQLIRAAGARLWYYSPDLNLIEQAFAKVKHWMRSAPSKMFRADLLI